MATELQSLRSYVSCNGIHVLPHNVLLNRARRQHQWIRRLLAICITCQRIYWQFIRINEWYELPLNMQATAHTNIMCNSVRLAAATFAAAVTVL